MKKSRMRPPMSIIEIIEGSRKKKNSTLHAKRGARWTTDAILARSKRDQKEQFSAGMRIVATPELAGRRRVGFNRREGETRLHSCGYGSAALQIRKIPKGNTIR